MGWHSVQLEEVFERLKSSEKGLAESSASERLEKYGKNELKQTRKFSALKILFEQFNSFLIYLLLVSSAIMLFFESYVDAVVIFAVLILNAGIGFFQQYRAENAIGKLKNLMIPMSQVIRDGKMRRIPSSEIVIGDILIFNSGDKVNADCRLISSENLQTNEAALTGESLPVDKNVRVCKEDLSLAKRENMIFTGTQIVRGRAKAIVVSTGMETVFGKIAGTLQEIETQKTPMQKKLDVFSEQLGLIILGVVAIVLFIGIFHGFGLFEMFMTAVTLAIGAIPEGLPAVLAIAFSISSTMLSKRNVVIRRLPAVESLGSVTVICTDKTGTLTEEKMEIQEIYCDNKNFIKEGEKIYFGKKSVDVSRDKILYDLVKTSILCNNARFEIVEGKYEFLGDPTEEALVSTALELGLNKKDLTEKFPRVKRFEFDSDRKMMSILRDNGLNNTLYSKGAPEKILSLCVSELVDGEIVKLSSARREELLAKSREMEGDALRVLGFAYKNFSKKENVEEKGLIFIGFMGMIDPPRKEVFAAIRECHDAGIGIKMITGDSVVTARAIAKKVGISGEVVDAETLEKMSDGDLIAKIGSINIFARMTPHQKLRIVKILQQEGETVAITGDGVNDVLALKASDIGISMGIRGTDVARDVSDIVLLDDNFASIVEGVRHGRKTYDNIKKFTKYMLSVNFSTLFLVGLLASLSYPLPIVPLQILWKNLITDSFPALTLVFERGEAVMKTKPRHETSILKGTWKFIIFGGILNFLACLFAYVIGTSMSLGIESVRTMVMTTGIIFELLFVYTCRSERPLREIGFFSNKWLNYAIFVALGLHLILLYTPLIFIFGGATMSLGMWQAVVPLSISGLMISEVVKEIRALRKRRAISSKTL